MSIKNAFQLTLERKNTGRPPVWFMRQAGRYHSHYQKLRERHSFVEVCKTPAVSCEAALGPLQDFNFDSAILFSDLLFPLEVMGMGLHYDPSPRLDWYLQDPKDLNRLGSGKELASSLSFQADAIKLLRSKLSSEKGLIGFAGGPFTLYCYAVEGSHHGGLAMAKTGLSTGLFEGFAERLSEVLAQSLIDQARAGADTVALLDTCAGEIEPEVFKSSVVPALKDVLSKFRQSCPDTPITYYSKGTNETHWKSLEDLPIACLGIDWHHEMAGVLERWSDRWAIQGNFDPNLLLRDQNEFEGALKKYFEPIRRLPAQKRQGWICGLGHGVLPKTPEAHIRSFMQIQRQVFG